MWSNSIAQLKKAAKTQRIDIFSEELKPLTDDSLPLANYEYVQG